jgi:hypothetical protein
LAILQQALSTPLASFEVELGNAIQAARVNIFKISFVESSIPLRFLVLA